MHGLINRSIQSFLYDTYGAALWSAVAQAARLPEDGFEAMLHYEDELTDTTLATACQKLGKPLSALLEDLGSYLVTREALRRLLRFGGVDYADFLMSLEELQGRGQMALPDLALPEIEVSAEAEGRYRLCIRSPHQGWGAVFTGLLRAMADDYGALALIEQRLEAAGAEMVSVELLEASFAAGRRFDLAGEVHP
jgi:hypothetical protein